MVFIRKVTFKAQPHKTLVRVCFKKFLSVCMCLSISPYIITVLSLQNKKNTVLKTHQLDIKERLNMGDNIPKTFYFTLFFV